MEYHIGNTRFKSKTAAQLLFKKYLAEHEPGTRPSGEMDVLLRCQIAKHPKAKEKVGAGISHFEIVRRLDAFGTKGFDLVRVDGSRTDFSYIECFNASTHRAKVLAAMRHEVDEQMIAARKHFFGDAFDGMATCAFTGNQIASYQAHMDHAYPLTFSRLVQDFLGLADLDIQQVAVTEGELFDSLTDRDLAGRWYAYHQQNAVIRPVEAKTNIRNSNRRPDDQDR